MAWLVLVVAGLLETVWALALKESDGFSKLGPSVLFAVACVASMVLLAIALRSLPVGTGYAVWTGIGAVGTVLLGLVLFDEPATVARLGCVGLILAGIVGLKLTA